MNFVPELIESPDSPRLTALCKRIRVIAADSHDHISKDRSPGIGAVDQWPTQRLEAVRQAGIYRWFISEKLGGLGWNGAQIVDGYINLASACLTTTFIITQQVAAIRRICSSENHELRAKLLPGLLTGAEPATVGISHLTTSRQHVREPVLKATERATGYEINGFSPWVTGASGASHVVMGAELEDRRQVLFVVPTDRPGVTVAPRFELVALSGSQTGPVKCENVMIDERSILAGPIEDVLALSGTPSTGSFQTSALAIGLTKSAIDFIRDESRQRPDLIKTLKALDEQHSEIRERLMKLALGVPVCTNEELRIDANSLVLRATQAAMVAAKGTGYVQGHPVGRWCQEALFFLVWSCPQAVLNANLCELAGIE